MDFKNCFLPAAVEDYSLGNTTWASASCSCSAGSSPLIAALPSALDTVALLISNGVFWMQVQGIAMLLVLAVLWFKASQLRLNEARKVLNQRDREWRKVLTDNIATSNGSCREYTTISHDAQQRSRAALPKVSVILAVKGAVGPAGMSNWRSQVKTSYGGGTEYIFCVESAHDPVCDAVSSLQRELRGAVTIHLVVAGLASRCSQQIHNQLAGANRASADSKYLLFLDDDIQCHPGTIDLLVSTVEEQPNALACTGYSFDIPQTDNLAAYAAMAYRVPIQLAMASGGRQLPVWGGCMMIRLEDLRSDLYGMASALSQHGYSNDLILMTVAVENGRDIICPASAIFPGRMSGNWTFGRYWNYVCRQTYALTTYCSPVALGLNIFAYVLYGYWALGVVAPLLPSAFQTALFLASLTRTQPADAAHSCPAAANWETISPFFCSSSSSSSCGIGETVAVALADASLSAAVLYCLAFILASLTVIRLFHTTVTLCNLLSPDTPPIRLRNVSLLLGLAGMVINLAVVPVVSVYTLFQPAITWAGITYVRRGGLIMEVGHPEKQQQEQQEGSGEENREEQ